MTIFVLALHLSGGVALGALYFGSMWWHAGLFGRGAGMGLLITSIAARFVMLAGTLTAVSLEGAWPLLVTALGILLAKWVVLRRAHAALP